MARPPVEWPIPAYVVELRERVIATFRVPGGALASLVPAPLKPALVQGRAVAAVSLGSGRRLSSVGAHPVLATEFRLAEIVTPVFWEGACRPTLRGNLLLRCFSDAHGLARLVRVALGIPCDREALEPQSLAMLPRERSESPWPVESVFSSHEAAESHLLHPQACFILGPGGHAIQAVPVHHHARSTTHLIPREAAVGRVADLLGAGADEIVLDHVFVQKRCTHTWSFPPERILTAPGTPRWAAPAIRAGRPPAGAQR